MQSIAFIIDILYVPCGLLSIFCALLFMYCVHVLQDATNEDDCVNDDERDGCDNKDGEDGQEEHDDDGNVVDDLKDNDDDNEDWGFVDTGTEYDVGNGALPPRAPTPVPNTQNDGYFHYGTPIESVMELNPRTLEILKSKQIGVTTLGTLHDIVVIFYDPEDPADPMNPAAQAIKRFHTQCHIIMGDCIKLIAMTR